MRTTDLTNTQHALQGISPGEAWDVIQRRDPGLDDRLRYAGDYDRRLLPPQLSGASATT